MREGRLPTRWHRIERQPLPRSLGALLMVLAVLVGLVNQVASHADAVHTHVVCPDHGEQHHAGAMGGSEAAFARTADWWSLSPQDHGPACLLVLLAHGGASPILPRPASIDVVFERIVVPSPTWIDAPVAPQRRRLELAPKTSPPEV